MFFVISLLFDGSGVAVLLSRSMSMAITKDVTPAIPTARYNVEKLCSVCEPLLVIDSMKPPKKGAKPLPT